MNRQRIFDEAAAFILKQGKKSCRSIKKRDGMPPCAYRGVGGCRCAIGYKIPDRQYDPGFEGCYLASDGVRSDRPHGLDSRPIRVKFKQVLESVFQPRGTQDWLFLRDLQRAHDWSPNVGFLASYRLKMIGVAKHYDLSSAAVER
jgi:hypothetical protein